MRGRAALAGLLWLGASGCGLGARALSTPTEYEAYRAVRAEYTAEARLRAGKRYLGSYPEGRFADEVRRRFDDEEKAFYAVQAGSLAGLGWYLQILPDGPHASEASLRLLELERQASQRRHDELVERGKSMEKRLARASASRRETVEALVGWVTALASSEAWGKPTWWQPAEVLRALRNEPDPGRCDERRCVRGRLLVFQIPVAGGGLEERAAAFDLILTLDRGRVVRGSVRGPELFSRLYEAARGQPLGSDRLMARAEAVSHALELVGGAFEAVAPGGRCDRGITPPVVMQRSCDGWQITATAGDLATDDDVIEIAGPVSSP